MLKKYITDLKHEFSGYNAGKLIKDILSGITVAAVALPLALAFGVSSGADAAAGLVTAIIGGLVIGLLGGASFQISGPTGAMSAILIGIVAQYGLQGVFVASLAAGVLGFTFLLVQARGAQKQGVAFVDPAAESADEELEALPTAAREAALEGREMLHDLEADEELDPRGVA